MSVWRWAELIAPVDPAARITLGEGGTPLVRSRRIGPALGIELSLKLESSNPTGSYKDRFAAVAVSAMRARGATRCLATSSGNTGAALAAYCAAAGASCDIALVETAPPGKIKQMLAYGATLARITGFGVDAAISDAVLRMLARDGGGPDASLEISAYRFSPIGMTGVETIAFEIAEQDPNAEHVFCPAGGGGLALAVARGFARLRASGAGPAPRVECVQPAGNDTIASALRAGRRATAVACATAISGLQVPTVIDGDETIAACAASGGTGHVVSDAEVWRAQEALAREEGVFAEPAAATALAGAIAARREGRIAAGARVVCLVTGSAFKDPVSLDRMVAGLACPTVSAAEWGGRASPGRQPVRSADQSLRRRAAGRTPR
ncbi:MAG TPA: pyridoxal-phosphate dependent enzyme [Planctomycetota bacterium]|nr:pyridoxal-phosphate dependent enzyme [Planctomycetota bacterium]